MAFVMTWEWWQIVLAAFVWWVTIIVSYWYGGHVASSKNRSRNRSQPRPVLYDDLQPDPPLVPPRSTSRPELIPWIAYDDGRWERLCSAHCNRGLVYGNRICGTCNGNGYEVVYEDPYQRSPSEMEASLPPPLPTTAQPSQPSQTDSSRGQVTFQWPPRELIEYPLVHDPTRQLGP